MYDSIFHSSQKMYTNVLTAQLIYQIYKVDLMIKHI